MEFKVPQFIETEDRVIGPLTIKQFIYIAIGGFFLFLLLMAKVKLYVFLFFTALVAPSVFLLAFKKMNGKDMSSYIKDWIIFFFKPKLYLWKKKKQ